MEGAPNSKLERDRKHRVQIKAQLKYHMIGEVCLSQLGEPHSHIQGGAFFSAHLHMYCKKKKTFILFL